MKIRIQMGEISCLILGLKEHGIEELKDQLVDDNEKWIPFINDEQKQTWFNAHRIDLIEFIPDSTSQE